MEIISKKVFATQDYQANEIVFRETPLAYCGRLFCRSEIDVPTKKSPEWKKLLYKQYKTNNESMELPIDFVLAKQLVSKFSIETIKSWNMDYPIKRPDANDANDTEDFRYIRDIVYNNMFCCDSAPTLLSDNSIRTFGNAFYKDSVYFNHACNFNCERIVLPTEIIIFTLQPVKKGDELTMYKFNSIRPNCKCNVCRDKDKNPHSNYFKALSLTKQMFDLYYFIGMRDKRVYNTYKTKVMSRMSGEITIRWFITHIHWTLINALFDEEAFLSLKGNSNINTPIKLYLKFIVAFFPLFDKKREWFFNQIDLL